MDLTTADDNDLISLVQEEDSDAALRELLRRNERVYTSVVNRFSFEHISGISQSEFLAEAPYRIREAAKCYDPTRGAKFSTHLHYEIKYALHKLYRKRSSMEVPVNPQSHVMLDIEADEYDEEQDAMDAKTLQLFSDMLAEEDADLQKLFAMRYPVDGSGPKTWQEIGEELGMSHEWARQLHASFLKKVKKQVEKTLSKATTPR